MRTHSWSRSWVSCLLVSCAAAPVRPAVSETEAKAVPVAAQGPEHGRNAGPGWTELPAALAGDPTKVAIPPLELHVVKPRRERWPNGLTVYWMQDPTVPLVTVRALVDVGTVDDPADKLGLADVAFELLSSGGAGSRDADALDALLEFHAAMAGGGAGEELSSFGLNARKGDVPTLLPVFADMLRRPRFQEDRFKLAVAQSLEDVRRRADSAAGLAERAVRKAVYGPDSPLAREETAETLKRLTREELRAWHARFLVPGNTTLLVSGDFDPAALKAQLEAAFGDWKGAARAPRQWATPPALKRRVIFVPKETAQVKIRVGGHGYARLSPDEYALRVTNTALGGGLGVGRLFLQIRDALGLAYSAGSHVIPGPTTGLFEASVDTRPAAAEQALAATLKLLEEARQPGAFNARELALARDSYLNSFAFRFDEPEKVLREKATFDHFGYPEDYLDRFRDNISHVDAQAVTAAATRLVSPDEFQIVVVGPEGKVGDLSRFGPVTVIRDVEAFR